MAYKNKNDEREYQKRHYESNKELYKTRAKLSRVSLRNRNRLYVRDIKESNPCLDCKKFYHYSQMDFDHVDNSKVINVSKITNTSLSISRIQEEINKCELVCANCHRLRTWERLQAG